MRLLLCLVTGICGAVLLSGLSYRLFFGRTPDTNTEALWWIAGNGIACGVIPWVIIWLTDRKK